MTPHIAKTSIPRRVLYAATITGLAAGLAAWSAAPYAPPPPPVFDGDEAFVDEVTELIDPRGVQGLSAVRFPAGDPSALEHVHGGTTDGETPVTGDTLFETGSLFKLFTAMTLADMVETGETSVDRTVAEVFPDAEILDPRVADATLEDLATHHSGLPTAPADDLFRHYVLPSLVFSDVYGHSRDPLSALAVTSAATPGEHGYSNLGFSLLGRALAAEAGAESYEETVRERVLDPLGMDDTVIVSGVPEGGAPPHIAPGHPTEPWHNTDYAPAGVATWSTPDDLARFLAAVIDGTAPGMSALEPVYRDVSFAAEGTEVPAPEEDDRGLHSSSFDQGLGWIIVEDPELGAVRLHTGGTLGSNTIAAFTDTEAVVVMSGSLTLDAVTLGVELLRDDPRPLEGPPSVMVALSAALTCVMALVPPLLLLSLVLRRRTLITGRPIDRLRIVSLSLGAVAWAATAQTQGDWVTVPMTVWAVGVGTVAAALVVGARHLRRVPVEAGRWRWLHVPVFVLSVLFSAALGALALWSLAITL
ncbi:serine hydrolase [Nocardiopsis sp. N85]|uniref:serine hydrolase domain-containing protein n=1 Tax=Nocardiopsis sp. N85 TaxID=3029400 RepID=UPI00237F5481|nr:serine hydrolase domain-containing protein [Nocardiopsis sp. N85]MDE3720905.1 serine hydrolase [Nocardiopsis sp. N85]